MMTKFKSESGRSIEAHRFLSEMMVRRQAHKEKVYLPKAYWQKRHKGRYIEWSKKLDIERFRAGALLKIYDVQVILNVLKENEWILSFLVKRLETLLQEEQRKLSLKVETREPKPEVITNTTSVPKKFGKASKRSKLK